MKLFLILVLLIRAFSVFTQDEEIIAKLRHFVDKNPKIDIDSKHCELTISNKLNAKLETPTDEIFTYFSGMKLPNNRERKITYFNHGGARFQYKKLLLFNFNLNRSHK